MLNKEKIANNFKLPIFYNNKKKQLSSVLKEDLELINAKENKPSVYQELLQTENVFEESLLVVFLIDIKESASVALVAVAVA